MQRAFYVSAPLPCPRNLEAVVCRCSSKYVLRNIVDFTRKHQCWSLFIIKLQALRSAKKLEHRCFPVKFAKFLSTLFIEHL